MLKPTNTNGELRYIWPSCVTFQLAIDAPMGHEIANNKGSGQTARMRRLVSQATKSRFLGLCMRAANVQASLRDCVACLSDRVLSQL